MMIINVVVFFGGIVFTICAYLQDFYEYEFNNNFLNIMILVIVYLQKCFSILVTTISLIIGIKLVRELETSTEKEVMDNLYEDKHEIDAHLEISPDEHIARTSGSSPKNEFSSSGDGLHTRLTIKRISDGAEIYTKGRM